MKVKKFDEWNQVKKKIDAGLVRVHANVGTIWFCSVGENIGHEEDGKNNNYERPVLILRHWTTDCFLGVPLTRTIRNGSYFYTLPKGRYTSCVILMQLRTFDYKRLTRKVRQISDRELYEIKLQLCRLIINNGPASDGRSSEAQQHRLRLM